jgi:hypothetical protein
MVAAQEACSLNNDSRVCRVTGKAVERLPYTRFDPHWQPSTVPVVAVAPVTASWTLGLCVLIIRILAVFCADWTLSTNSSSTSNLVGLVFTWRAWYLKDSLAAGMMLPGVLSTNSVVCKKIPYATPS